MKVFQIINKYQPYINYFESKYKIGSDENNFNNIKENLLVDGFYGAHILKPILNKSEDSFYCMWDYERLQKAWAKENNIITKSLKKILQEQIYKFKPDVIYNMSPHKVDFDLFKNLDYKPKLICWNANPYEINNPVLDKYDALLTSSIIKINQSSNAYLHYPAHFENKTSDIKNKLTDVLFYGQYSNDVFAKRSQWIEELIPFFQKKNINFKFALMFKERKEPLINKRFLWKIPFLQVVKPSRKISRYFSKPVFGSDLYEAISNSKIVFNMSALTKDFGNYKFNMRIFETLSQGTLMLSDEGVYPNDIIPNEDFITYLNFEDLKRKIIKYLENNSEREVIAKKGKSKIVTHYSKNQQWENFKSIVEKL